MGVNLPQDTDKNASPVVLENFDGFPDLTDSKADSQTVALNHALTLSNVEMITHAYAEKLVTDESGTKIIAVKAIVEGEEVFFSAGTFIVACGAVNSAALFLRSANYAHPNSPRQFWLERKLGRNLMLHHNGCLVAFTKKKNDCVFQKSTGIADFYHGADDSELPLGEIQLMGRNDHDTILWMAEDIYPGKKYDELKEMTIDFWLTAEDLPLADNRVTIKKDGSIKVSAQEIIIPLTKKLKDKLKDISKTWKIDPVTKTWYGKAAYDTDVKAVWSQNGTLRFGTDPGKICVTLTAKPTTRNVYVVDTSFFPSCVHSTALTIAANALRVGEPHHQ